MTNEKPLFIPLKTIYYEAFSAGTKTTEFRPHGPRWNAKTCRIGRRVTLSKGYGKGNRLAGVIAGYEAMAVGSDLWNEAYSPADTEAWKAIYPGQASAACIKIKLEKNCEPNHPNG